MLKVLIAVFVGGVGAMRNNEYGYGSEHYGRREDRQDSHGPHYPEPAYQPETYHQEPYHAESYRPAPYQPNYYRPEPYHPDNYQPEPYEEESHHQSYQPEPYYPSRPKRYGTSEETKMKLEAVKELTEQMESQLVTANELLDSLTKEDLDVRDVVEQMRQSIAANQREAAAIVYRSWPRTLDTLDRDGDRIISRDDLTTLYWEVREYWERFIGTLRGRGAVDLYDWLEMDRNGDGEMSRHEMVLAVVENTDSDRYAFLAVTPYALGLDIHYPDGVLSVETGEVQAYEDSRFYQLANLGSQ